MSIKVVIITDDIMNKSYNGLIKNNKIIKWTKWRDFIDFNSDINELASPKHSSFKETITELKRNFNIVKVIQITPLTKKIYEVKNDY